MTVSLGFFWKQKKFGPIQNLNSIPIIHLVCNIFVTMVMPKFEILSKTLISQLLPMGLSWFPVLDVQQTCSQTTSLWWKQTMFMQNSIVKKWLTKVILEGVPLNEQHLEPSKSFVMSHSAVWKEYETTKLIATTSCGYRGEHSLMFPERSPQKYQEIQASGRRYYRVLSTRKVLFISFTPTAFIRRVFGYAAWWFL